MGSASATASTTVTGTGAPCAASCARSRRYASGFHGDDLSDGGRVVLEVEAVAGAELEHPAAQVGERLAAVFVFSAGWLMSASVTVRAPSRRATGCR
jgi:hypothetical protein